MIAAMDFLEEQTNLRNEDNRFTDEWIAKMESSSDPRAAVALENLERVKQGLEPLPIVAPVPEYPVFNPSAEAIAAAMEPELVEAPIVAPVVSTTPVAFEPVGSAEEVAEVLEEQSDNLAPKVRGFRLVSAANWVIGVGVLAPAVAAGIAAVAGLNFVTSVLAGLIGVLVGVKVNVFALFISKRTERGLAVASRASFGVFGAIIPGLTLLLAGVFAVATIAFASARYFNNTIVGVGDFEDSVFSLGAVDVSLGDLFAVSLVLVAAVLAIFGGAFSRWARIVIGAVLLAAFVTYAVLTVPSVDYLNLAGVFQPAEFMIIAPIFALATSVLTYGIDGESLAAAAWGAKYKTLTWPIFIFGFLAPLLTYGHFAAMLNGHDFKDGLEVVQFVLSSGNQLSSTILVDFGILAVVGLLYVAISKLIEALKTTGTNHVGYGLATLVSLIVVAITAALVIPTDSLAFAIDYTALFLIPAAAWIGVQLTEALIRRGNYHDASLTRSYGFYGSVNWISAIGFIGSVTFALSVTEQLGALPWLGFLSNSVGWFVTPTIAALLAMGIEVLYTLATGIPGILRQQRETQSVADRQFDLLDVVVE